MARTDPQLNLRLPSDLKDRLEEAANENNRSVTAEAVARLSNSFVTAAYGATIPFLLSRMEMRTAEAELEVLELKLMSQELVWALKSAMLWISADKTENPELAARFDEWQATIDDSTGHLGEYAELAKDPVKLAESLSSAAVAKLDEFQASAEKTKKDLRAAKDAFSEPPASGKTTPET